MPLSTICIIILSVLVVLLTIRVFTQEKTRTPDIPPTVEIAEWKIVYKMEEDESSIRRIVYKSGLPYLWDTYWSVKHGFIVNKPSPLNEVKK